MHARTHSRGSRHGREMRSSVAGPVLPFLSSRETRFEDIAADAADYVMALWPAELGDVLFQWADMPPRSIADRMDPNLQTGFVGRRTGSLAAPLATPLI